MVVRIMGLIWVNMVGTSGVASTQYYGGQMAGLILQILYNIAPRDISNPRFWRWLIVYVYDLLAFFHLQQATLPLGILKELEKEEIQF